MLRYIGALLVFVAASGYSYARCTQAKRQIEETEALIFLVRRTGEEIDAFKKPLDRIYSDISNGFLDKIGFSEVLVHGGLSEAVRKCMTSLDEETLEEILAYASVIGGENAEGQVKLCSLVCGRLSERADKLKGDISPRLRMYRLLPVLAASSVILLII